MQISNYKLIDLNRLDAHNTIYDANCFNDLPEEVPLLINNFSNMDDIRNVIGSSFNFRKIDDKIICDILVNEDKVFDLNKTEFIPIGFRHKDAEDMIKNYYFLGVQAIPKEIKC